VEFPAEASISKLESSDRRIFTVLLRDITERKRAAEDERFLAQAGAQLAKSLEHDAVLRAIADLPIPRLADASIIDWRGADGQLRRLGSSCQRAQLTSALQAIVAAPLGWDSPSPIVDVMRRTTPELISGIDDNWLETYEEPHVAPHWRALGVHSMLILPLRAAAG